MKTSGIEPATSRFVAEHLNHCATAVPIFLKEVFFSWKPEVKLHRHWSGFNWHFLRDSCNIVISDSTIMSTFCDISLYKTEGLAFRQTIATGLTGSQTLLWFLSPIYNCGSNTSFYSLLLVVRSNFTHRTTKIRVKKTTSVICLRKFHYAVRV